MTKDYVYDSQGRVESIHHFDDANADNNLDTGETLLSGFEYTYNKDGSRVSESWTDEQSRVISKRWTYDGLNRLVKESYDGFDGSGNALKYVDQFRHDFSSNRIEFKHDDQTAGGPGSAGADATTTSTYDANDRLLTEKRDTNGDGTPDRTTTYGYGADNAGTDQTSKTVTGDQTETTNFTYDVAGRMTGVSITKDGTTTTVAYTYDHNGFRVERSENGGPKTIYHVDPSNHTGYAQVLEEGVDANSNRKLDAAEVQRAYTLAARVLTQAMTTQVLHLLSDAHGSNRAVLDAAVGPAAAAIVQNYAYSGYGSDLGLTASPLTGLRYAGEMIDPLTGLSFNRARWYDPSTGQWKQLDPYAGDIQNPLSLHDYLYTHGDPINGIDPSGEMLLAMTLVDTGVRLRTIGVWVAATALAGLAGYGAAKGIQATADAYDSMVDLILSGDKELAEIGTRLAQNIQGYATQVKKAVATAAALGIVLSLPKIYPVPRLATPTIFIRRDGPPGASLRGRAACLVRPALPCRVGGGGGLGRIPNTPPGGRSENSVIPAQFLIVRNRGAGECAVETGRGGEAAGSVASDLGDPFRYRLSREDTAKVGRAA